MDVKVAVECKSILLQKALENFLGKYLASSKQSDIVIHDYKSEENRSFYIGSSEEADLVKPFSKAQLLLALENRYRELSGGDSTKSHKGNDSVNFEILQKRIEMLTEEYKNNILEAIKAFYG